MQGYWSQAQKACVIPFMPPPTITAVTPNQGPQSGGQTVTITGTNFDTFGSTKIAFAGTPATNVKCTSHTSCTVTTPAGYGIEYAQATVNDFTFSGTPASEYLFGPYPPNCSAAFACTSTHVGATTITCPAGLTGLSLQRFDGSTWEQVNATKTATTFIDYYNPPPYTAIDYQVTATTSDGTTVSPMNEVYSHSCTCYTQAVCLLPNGTQIYPQVNSPPNWCTLKGGHMVNKQVCPS